MGLRAEERQEVEVLAAAAGVVQPGAVALLEVEDEVEAVGQDVAARGSRGRRRGRCGVTRSGSWHHGRRLRRSRVARRGRAHQLRLVLIRQLGYCVRAPAARNTDGSTIERWQHGSDALRADGYNRARMSMPTPIDPAFLRASDLFENQPDEVMQAVLAQGQLEEFGAGRRGLPPGRRRATGSTS